MTRIEIEEYVSTTKQTSVFKTKYFKNEIIPYIKNTNKNLPDNLTSKEILVWYLDHIETFPICQARGCSNTTKIKQGCMHYSRACSSFCSGKLTTQERTNTERKTIALKSKLSMSKHSVLKKQEIASKKRDTFLNNNNNSEAINKRKLTCLKKYGVENPMMNKEISEKSKENMKTPFETIKKKMMKTCLKKYGRSFYNNPEKISLTNKIVWGSGTELRLKQQNSFSYEESYIKHKKTIMLKYGVENISQIPEVQAKKLNSSYKSKEYILPSGNIIKVQGYEPKLLTELLSDYDEKQILTSPIDMPNIQYIGEDNKIHRYYPDMFIPSTNTIYEVKSTYTLHADEEKNIRKFKAVIDAGFKFVLKVY